MNKINWFLFFVLSILMLQDVALLAQTNVSRSVIGSAGGEDTTATLRVSYTVGEAAVTTLRSTGSVVISTQGFQQSLIEDTISFVFTSTKELCIGRADGTARIDSIKNCEGPYTILWSNGDVGNEADNLSAGTYSVQITSNDNCTQSFTFLIETENDIPCLLKFYSGITPNNDGLNDKWIIDNLELFPSNEVNIYNRVGGTIWSGKNYNNSTVVWGGENLSGGDAPSGTYFYVFESGSDVEKGWIELTR